MLCKSNLRQQRDIDNDPGTMWERTSSSVLMKQRETYKAMNVHAVRASLIIYIIAHQLAILFHDDMRWRRWRGNEQTGKNSAFQTASVIFCHEIIPS